MSEKSRFILDSDSLIRSKREHYAFDICPGFWAALIKGFSDESIGSIIPVRKEILKGKDALAEWIRDDVPQNFLDAVDSPDVQDSYAEVIQWVQAQPRFSTAAKQKFAAGADPWLVAFASANKRELVTYEVRAPESKAFVKLPDVARQFKVKCLPPYVMLRQLKMRLSLD